MRIFRENGKIRLQLMDMVKKKMLFDFTIEDDINLVEELKEHIELSFEQFLSGV